MTAPPSASKTLRTPRALADAGLVSPDRVAALDAVAARYAVAITPAMVALAGADGVSRQFTPHEQELEGRPEELADPIGDDAHSPVAGLVHRYPDRVLLKVTQTCAVYCRFCFRRETVGPEAAHLSAAQLDAALAYIAEAPQVWEVILSGGDPLVLSPRRLSALMQRLSAIDHVKVVRLHTRIPSVAPEAITPALVEALSGSGKAVWIALHANHPDELTPAARAACARLIDAGLPMVSQSVLLRGVNDDPQVLGALMRAFVETRIKPYYLHHADLAPGTAALRTDVAEGQSVMTVLRGDLSGLCQPTYVLDIPGGHGKVPIGPAYFGDGTVTDPWGQTHLYPPRGAD